jgi:hypothetical protein
MKILLVANLSKAKRYSFNNINVLLKAQIENSLDLGWSPADIILLSNFDYDFMGVKSCKIKLNKSCLTGSKMFGIKYLFENNIVDEEVWAHDLDCWQNVPFTCPEFKDVGIACYSTPKFNGGSIFWKKEAEDIIDKIIRRIKKDEQQKEEPTLNKVLKSKRYKERVTILNNTYNVGCSGYVKRWNRSIKPLRVCHFHPYNKTAWETHALDRNGLDTKGISNRLENLLRKYYPNLATKLSPDGKIAQKERREKRLLLEKVGEKG